MLDHGSHSLTTLKDRQGNSFSSNKSKKFLHNQLRILTLKLLKFKKSYALFGVNDLVIADSPDALLISDKDKSSEIKNFANKIISANSFSEFNKEVFRPWGSFTTILNGPGFQVKIIKIKSNQKLVFSIISTEKNIGFLRWKRISSDRR